MSSLFYLFIGCVFLRKLLQIFFSEKIIAFTLLFIGLGTNFYYYTVIAVGMPHIYLFSLLAVISYYTVLWYEHPKFKTSILLGCLAGLMVLIRPVMLIVLLFPILYNITSIKERLLFFKEHILQVVIIFFFSFLIWGSTVYLLENCIRRFSILFLFRRRVLFF